MKVRFGRVNVEYYQKLEKYLFDDLNAIFLEGIRNENYVYGCYFAAHKEMGKIDSTFKSLHFENIALPEDYEGMPAEICRNLRNQIDEIEDVYKRQALLCALVLLTTAIPSVGALAGEANRSADILSTLGLVNGTTNAGYDLTSPATRAQAAVLLVRLAGAEEAAAADPWFAGYRDVPAWCKDAVDYATHQG